MSAQNVFDPSKMKSGEDYATALVMAMISVRSMEKIETTAFTAGLLDEEEAEVSKSICWELRRLMALYTGQINNLRERMDINVDTVTTSIQHMYKVDSNE